MKSETIGALYKTTDMNEKELLFDILNNFGDSFNKEKARNFQGSFHFLVLCNGNYEEFTIRVYDQQFQILQDYRDTHPYLNLKCTFPTFCNITLGKLNPIPDILSGKIQLDRNLVSIGRFAKFGAIFSNRTVELKLPTAIPHAGEWKQPENILLVNGSPRKNGSTKLILGDPRLQPVREKIRNATASVARSIFQTGKIPAREKRIIEKEDYVSKKDFHFYATNYWMQRFKTDYWN